MFEPLTTGSVITGLILPFYLTQAHFILYFILQIALPVLLSVI